jgi:hypothetical protein
LDRKRNRLSTGVRSIFYSILGLAGANAGNAAVRAVLGFGAAFACRAVRGNNRSIRAAGWRHHGLGCGMSEGGLLSQLAFLDFVGSLGVSCKCTAETERDSGDTPSRDKRLRPTVWSKDPSSGPGRHTSRPAFLKDGFELPTGVPDSKHGSFLASQSSGTNSYP